jgi:hypothetical protein
MKCISQFPEHLNVANCSHDVQQEIITLGSMSLKQLQRYMHMYPFVLVHQQPGNPGATKFAVFIASCMALCPIQNCATISLTISLWSSVMGSSTFYSL